MKFDVTGMELLNLIETYRLRPGEYEVKAEIYSRITDLQNHVDHVTTNQQTRGLLDKVLNGRGGAL